MSTGSKRIPRSSFQLGHATGTSRCITLVQLDKNTYFNLTNSSLHMSLQVLAMARPWQENLLKHNIPQAFQDAGVGMVLNLQVASWQLLLPSIKLYIALRRPEHLSQEVGEIAH